MSQIQYIRSRLFIDGINCKFNKDNTCKCSTPGCPYRVKVTTGTNAAGKKAAVGVAQVLFGHHWHETAILCIVHFLPFLLFAWNVLFYSFAWPADVFRTIRFCGLGGLLSSKLKKQVCFHAQKSVRLT